MIKRTPRAILKRDVLTSFTDPQTKFRSTRTVVREAGKVVYVERKTRYGYEIRVPGTLNTATIPLSAFTFIDGE